VTNVIHVRFPSPKDRRASQLGPVLKNFATARRATSDAFWWKENGELLNVLETTGTAVTPTQLAVYESTYAGLAEQMVFFPQYYRFLVSIALDLEALGMPGDVADRLCHHVLSQDLIAGETSDIQRLEAQRLLSRRGYVAPIDSGVDARARAFIQGPDRFALPNKKAAYELTHIVFYLTEYGRRAVDLGPEVKTALENVGIWAFLDGNLDLLSEVCIAMRYLSYNPTMIWEDWVAAEMQKTTVQYAPALGPQDDYHAVFMGTWLSALKGRSAFEALSLPQEGPSAQAATLIMTPPVRQSRALREMSRHLFSLGTARSADWARMQTELVPALSREAQERLRQAAKASSDGFERFFESFARAVPA